VVVEHARERGAHLGVLTRKEVLGAKGEHRPETVGVAWAASALHGLAPPQLVHALGLGAGCRVVHHIEEQVLEAAAGVAVRGRVGLPDGLQLLDGRQIWLWWQACQAAEQVLNCAIHSLLLNSWFL
jgi:hypothetical protein